MIKADDVAFVRFRAPDLDKMEGFLSDFGMVRAARDADTLYMRGGGSDPFVHVTHKGEPGFAGLAFRALSVADLDKLAARTGAKVEALDGPGGGKVVKLKDPDGFPIEAVAGREAVAAVATPPATLVNDVRAQPRANAPKLVGQGASHVKRFGHCVLNVSNFRTSEAWYKEHFGFITSDEVKMSPEFSLGAFMRCDRGDKPADHHTLFLLGTGTPQFNHAAYEVTDMDDLMSGHDHLEGKSYQHLWGVGRHVLGGQIFDYWRDPWGHTLEHWTDGDLMTANWGSRDATPMDLMGVQWGMKMPANMG